MEYEALEEDLADAALTLAYVEASFTPLSVISTASAAASTHLSRLSSAASIRRSSSVRRSSSSSVSREAATLSSSVEAPANLKQSEM